MDVFETLHHRAWLRAGHTGGFDERGPVVDGRRAAAPNMAAEEEA